MIQTSISLSAQPLSPMQGCCVHVLGSASCVSSGGTCCERLTNCPGTEPSAPSDRCFNWMAANEDRLEHVHETILWRTPIILPALVPEATGSQLSASTDPSDWGAEPSCRLLISDD
ncbi:unnamed protein product [Pleuronectes platessa]|uniref:Uncharacterized protein n=1 Tax=Pleuronectes platessa TaxID=8262 RepID=A0A9N7UAB7_PLEPL|nr:unnamed protein product [Pleuronectes platessa]